MTVIDIPKPNIKEADVTIKGTSPLIFHKFSEKAKKQIQDIQAKSAKAKRKPKTQAMIDREYKDSFYYDSKGQIAFPALNIKNSMVGAARFIDLKMTEIRGSIFVVGDDEGLIPVKYKNKSMRTDPVKVTRGGTDMRYRGQVEGWSMDFAIKFNANFISKEQVANLLETAGFSQGLGEWRPERNGNYGTFTMKE